MGASPALAVAPCYEHPRIMGASPVLGVVGRFSERGAAEGVLALLLHSTARVRMPSKTTRETRVMGRRVMFTVGVAQLLARSVIMHLWLLLLLLC